MVSTPYEAFARTKFLYQVRDCERELEIFAVFKIVQFRISNSNWTEWSTIQAVIGRVISKSAEREAQGRFEITSTITP